MATGFSDAFSQAYLRSYDRSGDEARHDKEMAFREKADAREQAKHDADLKRQRGIDDAQFNYSELATKGVRRAGLPTADLNGPPEPVYEPADRKTLMTARRGLAAAKGDVGALGAIEAEGATLEEDEILANAEVTDDLVAELNNNDMRLTVGKPDKDGITPMSFTRVDGSAEFLRLSAGDKKKLAGARALWEKNPVRAMKLIEEVNGDLAATIRQDNADLFQVTNAGNNDQFQRLGLADARNRTGIAATAAGNASRAQTTKEVVLTNGKDTRLFVVDLTKTGKDGEVVFPPGWRPVSQRPQYTEKDVEGVVERLSLEPGNKGIPYQMLRRQAVGLITGEDDGGLPDAY